MHFIASSKLIDAELISQPVAAACLQEHVLVDRTCWICCNSISCVALSQSWFKLGAVQFGDMNLHGRM